MTLNLLLGNSFNSELELNVHLNLMFPAGLALTVQLTEATSPWATPYTNFWAAEHTGLTENAFSVIQ